MADDRQAIEQFGAVFLDSYFIVDRDRRILSFNQAFSQMLELRPGERRKLINTPCYERLRLEICKDNCIALECIKRGAPVRMEEIKGSTADGQRELVLELSAIPLKDETGNITSVFVTHRDVTDERRLKARYLEEQTEHRRERASLLKIIEDRDVEVENLRRQSKVQTTPTKRPAPNPRST